MTKNSQAPNQNAGKQNTVKEKFTFEEFKLFYESAEKVTERRLETNRWNYSICSAILISCAGVINWATTNPRFLIGAVVLNTLLTILAGLFCLLWVEQIKEFKFLNYAKFKVMNEMAPSIVFSSTVTDERISARPFEKEWKMLQDQKAVSEMLDYDIVAFRSSNTELLLPRAFIVLFAITAILSVVILIFNWNVAITSSTFVLATQTPVTPIITPTP